METKSLLPSPAYRRAGFTKGGISLFGKEGPFDRAHGHELVEWLGEISGRICILNYGLLSNLEDFKNQYDCDLFAEKKKMLDKLMEEGFISIQNGRLFPAQTGLVVADSLSLI